MKDTGEERSHEFEADSLHSIENYLSTLQFMNEEITNSALVECRKDLNKVVQTLSYAVDVFKGFLLIDSNSINDSQELKSFSSITFRFIDSVKLLNDSFFLSLTGRYPISRILERVAIESVVRGIFYYGCSINDVSDHINKKYKKWKQFMKIIIKIKKENPSASPLGLESYVTDELQGSNTIHAGLKQMLRQLHAWKLALQEFDKFSDFLDVFKESYKTLSGFIHSELSTTYTYIEKTTQKETRVIWGAQFSKDELEKETEEIVICVDFLLALVLGSLSPEIITDMGIEHLKGLQEHFAEVQNTLVLSFSATENILSHRAK
jgi:hypothetical protein